MIDRMTSRANLKRIVQCIMQFVFCHIPILLPYSILSSLLSLFYTLYCPLYFFTSLLLLSLLCPLSATLYVRSTVILPATPPPGPDLPHFYDRPMGCDPASRQPVIGCCSGIGILVILHINHSYHFPVYYHIPQAVKLYHSVK